MTKTGCRRSAHMAPALAAFMALTTSCSTYRLGSSHAMKTGADERVVIVSPIDLDDDNRAVPRQVICLEPSPDIAKAVGTAFAASNATDLKAKAPNSPVEVDLETVTALSKSRVEAVAQMTERLATIQLLRDAQYRACEAYANGAITDVMYGVLVSRFDDTMITLLMGELAAGNFGRSLAAATTQGNSSASANKGLRAATEALVAAQKQLEDKKRQLSDAEKAQSSLPEDAEQKAKDDAAAAVTDAQKEVSDAEAQAEQAREQASVMMHSSANTEASSTATPAAGLADAVRGGVEVARVLENMQKTYLHNINADPQIVTCILALGASRKVDPSVKAACLTFMRDLGQGSMDLLKEKVRNKFILDQLHQGEMSRGLGGKISREKTAPANRAGS